jgi:hypothetical protein
MKSVVRVAIGAVLALGHLTASAAVRAQAPVPEFCVLCAEPTGLYRCRFDGAAVGSTGAGVAVTCLKAIAADGRHGSCSIKRTARPAVCDGQIMVVAAANVGIPAIPQDAASATLPQSISAKSSEPATVAEALARAKAASDKNLDQTNQQLNRAATATTTAVQRTFSCVMSLFKNCKAEAATQ